MKCNSGVSMISEVYVFVYLSMNIHVKLFYCKTFGDTTYIKRKIDCNISWKCICMLHNNKLENIFQNYF